MLLYLKGLYIPGPGMVLSPSSKQLSTLVGKILLGDVPNDFGPEWFFASAMVTSFIR